MDRGRQWFGCWRLGTAGSPIRYPPGDLFLACCNFANAEAIADCGAGPGAWRGGCWLRAGAAYGLSRGAWRSPAWRAGAASSFIVRAMRLRGRSTSSTRTLTMAPVLTTSRASLTNLCASWLTCTSASWCTPRSTKAPNWATLLTVPSSTMPSFKSVMSCTPPLKRATLKSGRGARLFQFGQDVRRGDEAEFLVGKQFRPERLEHVAAAHQFGHGFAGAGHDLLDHRVGLGVHAGHVERVLAATDAQKARALLKGLGPQAGHVQQLPAAPECAMGLAPAHHGFGHAGRQAPDPAQHRHPRPLPLPPPRFCPRGPTGRRRGSAGARWRCSGPRPPHSRSLPPPCPGCGPARFGSRRAGTGPRRCSWGRS